MPRFSIMLLRLATAALALGLLGCRDASGERVSLRGLRGPERPDEHPVVVNAELPFRYPPALYTGKVQGNVTLRLYVDRDGLVLPDSTRVEESSGFSALDSAAVRGSQELQFIPAKLRGEPMGVSVLFPVYFRHPEAAPLPGDTILRDPGERPETRDSGAAPNAQPPASRP
jgi:TonB family protein